MAVYCFGDVHGALTKLRELMNKVGIHPEKGDSLYFLGDYVDWGEESIETLRFLRDLEKTCPDVHCLMGNHEFMLAEILRAEREGREISPAAMENYLVENRGEGTYRQFKALPAAEQEELLSFMENMPLAASVTVSGVRYLMAHAYPYNAENPKGKRQQERAEIEALWRRLLIDEDPFENYTGDETYDWFLCGHTVTSYYNALLSRMAGLEFRARVEMDVLGNRIFYGKNFIDLDCGAKLLGLKEGEEALVREAEYAQLACLRLDDMREFYVKDHSYVESLAAPALEAGAKLRDAAIAPALEAGAKLRDAVAKPALEVGVKAGAKLHEGIKSAISDVEKGMEILF